MRPSRAAFFLFAYCCLALGLPVPLGCGDSSDNTQTLPAGAGGGVDASSEAQADSATEASDDVVLDSPAEAPQDSSTDTVPDGQYATTLRLPQFVHAAARVNSLAFQDLSIVIEFSGQPPDTVELVADSKPPFPVVLDQGRFLATINVGQIGEGDHVLKATAKVAGSLTGLWQGTLVVANDSMQWTDYATVGPGFASHLMLDSARDQLGLTWVSMASGHHQVFLSYLDGAFRRLSAEDKVISDPDDSAVKGWTAFGQDAVGVVYVTPKPNDVHWLVKLKVVDLEGKEKVATQELTQGESAFHEAQAGVDPGGFSAAWLHITPPKKPSDPLPPVELRFARYDLAKAALQGPILLDSEQPQPTGSTQGPLALATLSDIGIACNSTVCVVSYTREVYNSFVALNIPKIHLAVVDLASGTLAGPATAVSESDWDSQQFGQQLIALQDGTFVLVYTANDTQAALSPKSPCDESMPRDLLYAVKLSSSGVVQEGPSPIFDNEGVREYPRIAPHPSGYALFWEDQRSECAPNGHIRMALNIVPQDFSGLLRPYLEVPNSVVLPPMDPTVVTTGTNFSVGWSDNRHGNGLLDVKSEVFLESYW